jgi:hypothetical protein
VEENTYRVSVGSLQEIHNLEDLGVDGQDTITMAVKEIRLRECGQDLDGSG